MPHNGGNRSSAENRGATALIALVADHPAHTPHTTEVVVYCDEPSGGYGPDDPVTISYEDGRVEQFNRRELLAAIGGHAAARLRRNETADRVDAKRAA